VSHTIVATLIATVAWLAWHLLGELVGEVVGYTLRPVTRPLWRVIVRARWPWPLLVLLGLGLGLAVTGLQLMPSADWRAGAGVLMFLGGTGLSLFAPLLWRDARRERTRVNVSGSRPVV
jgi:hypothetical protein